MYACGVGDVPWDVLITLALQALDTGMTELFIALLGASLNDKFKKPDANVERLLDEQRGALAEQCAALARLDALIGESPEKQAEEAHVSEHWSDPTLAATFNDALERARAGRQFHESVLLKIQDSDPTIAAMVDDALRQLEARGAKALVNDVHAAGNWSRPAEDARRWWLPGWGRQTEATGDTT
jgi:hypothetical protein